MLDQLVTLFLWRLALEAKDFAAPSIGRVPLAESDVPLALFSPGNKDVSAISSVPSATNSLVSLRTNQSCPLVVRALQL